MHKGIVPHEVWSMVMTEDQMLPLLAARQAYECHIPAHGDVGWL